MGIFKDVQEFSKQNDDLNTGSVSEGIEGTAQVLAVGASTGSLNRNPRLPVKLLVNLPGQPPRPMTPTLVVPTGQMPRLVPGATLPVTITPSNPQTVAINWAVTS